MRSKKALELLDKIRSKHTPYVVNIAGLELTITKNVYPPGQVNALMTSVITDPNIGIKAGQSVLDYGTGSGLLAILSARLKAEVIAIDINPEAIECAKYNAKHNHSHNIDFRISNCLEGISDDETFDIILAALPWDDAVPQDSLEMAVFDQDYKMRKALFQRAKKILLPGGKIFFSYSERMQKIAPIEQIDPSFNYSIVANKIINNEPHFIYIITRI